MDELVVSDTSCLIVLTNSGQLDLLPALFSQILVTPEVATEYGLPLPIWIQVQSPHDPSRQKILQTQLDIGEASAISLALEHTQCLLLIDEKKGRRVAQEMGLKIIGTVRVLMLAKEKGLLASLRVAINLLTDAGFRLAPNLVEELLRKYDE